MTVLVSLLALFQASFSDVPPGHWATRSVNELAAAGILRGYPAEPSQRHGKTDEQILAMGRAAWVRYAAEEKGKGTTADYMTAEGRFGQVLRNRNQRLLNARPMAERQSLSRLRNRLTSFAVAMNGIQRSLAGGGTMYSVMAAAIDPDVEEVLYAILTNADYKGPAAPDVDLRLDQVDAQVRTRRNDIDRYAATSGISALRAEAWVKSARSEWRTIRSLTASLPAAQRLRVAAFIAEQATFPAN